MAVWISKVGGLDKRGLLLEQIIREYINNPEPIGSENLRVKLDIKISSATIRNYFKKLANEGALKQVHISSGRIPTHKALQNYWKHKLLPLEHLMAPSLGDVKNSARQVGLFCLVKFYEPNRLQELLCYKERFLILVLEKGEVIIPYSTLYERFLQDMMGMDISDILRVCEHGNAHEITDAIRAHMKLEKMEKEGAGLLIEMASGGELNEEIFTQTIEGRMMDKIADGIYFRDVIPEGYLAIKQDLSVEGREAKLFFIGSLERNFEKFYMLARSEHE